MPRSQTSSSTSKSRSSQGRAKDAAGKPGTRKGPNPRVAKAKSERENASRIVDDYARRDIIGIAFGVGAVVLFIAAVMHSDAIVTSFISTALHLTLGIGAYILPFFLLAIGATFLVRFNAQRVPTRVAVGLAIVFVAILSILSLSTPIAEGADAAATLFRESELTARGGYVGAGIAWLGFTLFGQAISLVIMAGVGIAGICVIGLSISKLIERIREATAAKEEELDARRAAPFARVKRSSSRANAAGDEAPLIDPSAETRVLPAHPLADPAAASTRVLEADSGTGAPAAKTRTLGRAERKAAKAAKAAQAVATSAAHPGEEAATETLAESATRRIEPIEGTSSPLTRKLGAKKKDAAELSEPDNAGKPAVKKRPSRPKAPVSAPSPQEGFVLPSMDLLSRSSDPEKDRASEIELQETAARLQETLEDFNIMAQVVGWVAGPTVTLFKVDLPAGVRVSRVTALNDDIALALAAPGVRIFAPIPGTNYVGIEVPNKTRQTVFLGDVLDKAEGGPLLMAIGKDVEGTSIITDLAKMPHLLIGGTTGSGKSVSINAMIMSILMRATPAEVRFIMIDPKRVEFTPYNGIPHLYVPVVTEAKEAASALSWGVAEMERRLKVFSKVGARNIGQYNAKVNQALADAEETDEPVAQELAEQLPYIVIIIDELADLMMNVGKEVEFSISRIAQLARAAGIHLIVATQRPSTNVVTGLIKANITNRIAFNVASGIDSRVVLDTPGAENLIGLGDMLFSKPEYAKPQRIQGCYVSEDEINAVVDALKEQGKPEYHSEILKTNLITLGASSPDGSGGSVKSDDPRLWEAADIVVSSGLGSTSNIQRRLQVGYSRAGRIMDMLEEKGIVGPPNGSKPREVLVDEMELETLKAFEMKDAAEGGAEE